MQREIESGLNRRMRRELQVEPLILCLVQPAPSGTPAYKPRVMEDKNTKQQHRSNNNPNHSKKNINQHTQNRSKEETNPNKENELSTGRTRRRRSAIVN